MVGVCAWHGKRRFATLHGATSTHCHTAVQRFSMRGVHCGVSGPATTPSLRTPTWQPQSSQNALLAKQSQYSLRQRDFLQLHRFFFVVPSDLSDLPELFGCFGGKLRAQVGTARPRKLITD